ncbi:MAG: ABC transporter substrate-binding protein [Candidatus Roizmanbacteria bacterium]|nr:ABC transporter substrate-binding protein [Candidatus Roizmanbacteria bacterium]
MSVQRTFLISTWLIKSFIKRYKTYVIIAAVTGALVAVGFWKLYPYMKTNVFPERTVVGIVGSYGPTELPLSIQNYISAGFTTITENGEAIPLVASKWEVSKEGTRYFFHLNQGVRWHDGEELTAHDVNYNFRDVTIAPADRYTLKMELEEPFSPLPTLLSRPLFKPGLIGIGPYEVVRLDVKGEAVESLLLRRIEDYRLNISTTYTTELIEFRFYPSIEAAVLAFKLGEIDHIESLLSKTELANEGNVSVTQTDAPNTILALFYNQQHELLGSKEFRQALSYATPDLSGTPSRSVIPSTSWAYNENAKQYQHNIEKAREMLEKSEIESPSVTLSAFPEYLADAETIASAWRELGVEVTVQVVRFFPPDYQVLLGVQEIPSDPDQYQLWHSTQEQTNITHYNNPKIDKLLEEGRTLQLKEERTEVYREFQRYIMEDNPAHFLVHPTVYRISRT